MNNNPNPSDAKAIQNEFYPLELSSQLNNTNSNIQWTRFDQVAVVVTLEEFGQKQTTTQTWPVATDSYQKIRSKLAQIKKLKQYDMPGQYTLISHLKDEKDTQAQWSFNSETDELKAIRTDLEKLGHLHYVKAHAYSELSEALYQQDNVEQAMKSLKAGIDALGDHYQNPDLLDDTGMKLVAGEGHEDKGEYETAFYLYKSVLESRMDVYSKINLSGS